MAHEVRAPDVSGEGQINAVLIPQDHIMYLTVRVIIFTMLSIERAYRRPSYTAKHWRFFRGREKNNEAK